MEKAPKPLIPGSKQSIIQCPRCETRFSVAAQLLGQQGSPRFHCSRCDHVFGIDEQKARGVSPEPEPSIAQQIVNGDWTPPSRSSEPLSWNSPSRSTQTKGLEIPSVKNFFGLPSAPHESFDVPKTSRPLAEPIPETMISEQSDLEIPQISFGFFEGIKAQAQMPPSTPEVGSTGAETIKLDQPTLTQGDPIIAPPKSSFSAKNLNFELPEGEKREITETDLRTFTSKRSSAVELFQQAERRRSAEQESTPLGFQRTPSAWNSFFMLLAPIAVALSLLGVLAYYAETHASVTGSVVASLVPAAPQAAPPGLHIRNTTFKTVTLDSGERVSVISGTLVNGSEKRFRDVQIEGVSFGPNGTPLAQARASASSSLSNTRMKSLTVEMIENLQTAASKKRFELRPGEEQEFSVALLDPESANANNFSARIYSVNY